MASKCVDTVRLSICWAIEWCNKSYSCM